MAGQPFFFHEMVMNDLAKRMSSCMVKVVFHESMRRISIYLTLLTFVFSSSWTDAAIPRGSIKWEQREKAVERALKSKKLLVYIYTRNSGHCGEESATLDVYMKALGSKAVIIHLPCEESKEWKGECDKAVVDEILRGKVVPRMVIVDPNDHKILKSVSALVTKKDPKKMSMEIKDLMKSGFKKPS